MLLMPGDILYGADPNIDGGQRVSMGRVLLPTMRTQRETRYWSPHFSRHSLLFYGDNHRVLQGIMTSWVKAAVGANSRDASLMILDRNELLLQSVLDAQLDKRRHLPPNVVTYRENPESLGSTVDAIIELRDHIREQMLAKRLVNAPNRRGLIIVLVLDETDIMQLSMYADAITELMDMSSEMIYLSIVAKNALDFPLDFIQSANFTFFTGQVNEEYCLNTVFPDEKYAMSIMNKYEEVGLIRMVDGYGIEPVTSLEKPLTDWYVQKEQHEDDAEARYQQLLKSLDDGT